MLYFEGQLNKLQPRLLGVLVRDVNRVFKNEKVKLPINISGKIDFSYMENYIKEIEEAQVQKVATYLLESERIVNPKKRN